MDVIVENTTKEDQQLAKFSLEKLYDTISQLETDNANVVSIRLQHQKKAFDIPEKAFRLLFAILTQMADGKSFSLIEGNSDISTQQAADLLNVSRPHLVTLLENGTIPFKKVGTHRRVNLTDVIDYSEKQKRIRDENLSFLAKEAQEQNLGY